MNKTNEFKRIFRHIPEEIMNRGEVEFADLEMAEDYVEHIPMPPGFPANRQGFKEFVKMLRTAFPDLHYRVEHLTTTDLVGENQKVAHYITARGTHLSDWGPIPATGKCITWSEIHFGLYVRGVLVEHWGNIDSFTILQQMDVIPGWETPRPVPPRPVTPGNKRTTNQENVAIVRRYVSEVWNKGKLGVADQLIHPQCIDPSLPQLPAGPEGVKLAVKMHRKAFPDLRIFIQDCIAEENVVVIRFIMTGTHEDEYVGIAATGKDIEMQACEIYHIGDGQIIERTMVADMLGMLGQLGVGG